MSETTELAVAAPPSVVGQITPAQARVDSISRTMDAAMSRASTLQLSPEEITALKADFPDNAFRPGAAGKENLIYIEHAFLRDRFDTAIGMGSWTILRTRPHWAEEFTTTKREQATRIYADCGLLIRGCMVAESIGEMVYYPNNASQNYGDAAEGAVTAAFRRCAKNFGVGLQAWKKEFCEGWWRRRQAGKSTTSTPPPAQKEPGEKADFLAFCKSKGYNMTSVQAWLKDGGHLDSGGKLTDAEAAKINRVDLDADMSNP